MSYFRISDLVFDIESAILQGTLGSDSLLWSLKIVARERQIRGEMWHPCAFIQEMNGFGRPFIEIGELLPYRTSWNSAWEEGRMTENGAMSVFGTSYEISSAMLSIGADLTLRWSGVSDVNFDERYGEDLPIEIWTPLVFSGILTETDDPEVESARLKKFCIVNCFQFDKMKRRFVPESKN